MIKHTIKDLRMKGHLVHPNAGYLAKNLADN